MPWQGLMIDAAGVAQPCAYRGNYTNTANAAPLGNVNDRSLGEVWNGAEARRVRRLMAAGDLEGAGCGRCLAVAQGQPLGLEYDARAGEGTTTPYAANLAVKIDEALDGADVLRSKPSVLYFTPDHRCNLACLHCYQNTSRNLRVARREAGDEVLDLVPVLADVVAGGGEPLILPFWRRFLASDARASNPYLRFATTTNATVVREDVVAALGRFDRLSIIVSIDGATKETFEFVRARARWEPFLANARRLRALCATKGSFYSFNISVMKANILELPALVELCASFEAPFNYQPVVAYPAAQSLRCFNDPHREMAGWAAALDEAERALEGRFLPALRAAGAAGRAEWSEAYAPSFRGHVEALRALVPWHLLAVPHRRREGRLPRAARLRAARPAGVTVRRGAEGFVALFYDRAAGPGADPRHYAALGPRGRVAVHLPDGVYGLAVVAEDDALPDGSGAWEGVTVEAIGERLTVRRDAGALARDARLLWSALRVVLRPRHRLANGFAILRMHRANLGVRAVAWRYALRATSRPWTRLRALRARLARGGDSAVP